jgi:hypothetical protein
VFCSTLTGCSGSAYRLAGEAGISDNINDETETSGYYS